MKRGQQDRDPKPETRDSQPSKSSHLLWFALLPLLLLFVSSSISLAATPFLQTEVLPNALEVRFDSPLLEFGQREWNGQTYDTVTFEGAHWYYEDGMPLLPYYTQLVGIPTTGTPSISMLEGASETRDGIRLQPVTPALYRSLSDQPTPEPGPPPTMPPYSVPTQTVQIEPVGYVRQQRVARLQIFPVQFDASQGQIRWHRTLRFQIEFPAVSMAPALSGATEDSPASESMYQTSLLNYGQAKGWRLPRPSRKYAATPTVPNETFKIYIREDGVYRLKQRDLVFRSESLVHADPRNLRLFNGDVEMPIYVEGEEDGSFDTNDAIIFFGQKLTNQKFTTENAYLLTVGDGPGLRIGEISGKPPNTDPVTAEAFRAIERYEEDIEYDPLLDVRAELIDHYFWFGLNGSVDNARRRDMEFDFPYATIAPTESGVLRVQLQGISYNLNQKHLVDVIFNGRLITTADWNAQGTEQVEAVAPQWLFNPTQQNFVTFIYRNDHDTPGSQNDVVLDWIEFEYWRKFSAEQGRLEFSNEVLPRQFKGRRFHITDFKTDQIRCYQIQDGHLAAKITDLQIEPVDDKFAVTFDEPAEVGFRQYYAFEDYMTGMRVVKDKPSNLRAASHRADYVIISHEDFLDAVEELAEYRRSQGHEVMVVDVQDIYDEFNSGRFDPGAIRGFLRYAYHNWAVPPTYVLLVGDAHYDYKGAIVRNYWIYYHQKYNLYPIYVPTYHGWAPESGETAMDHRFVTVSGDDPLPDMAIGRLPVQNSDELRNMIRKIIEYEALAVRGDWQRRIIQVADNSVDHPGDEEFERSQRKIAKEFIPVGYRPKPIYLGQIGSPWQTNREIMQAINQGALITEYSGHGGRETWADEGIFRIEDIPRLNNRIMPWVITTTCLNGMFDFPQEVGRRTLSEEFLLERDRGAIACLSATRLTFAQANSAFDEYLFTEIFTQRPAHLGLIVMNAKINFLANAVSIWVPGGEQYTLFGDPALRLALPDVDIPVALNKVAVDPTQQLLVTRGALQGYRHKADGTLIPEPVSDFNGQITAEVTYANNLDDDPSNDLPIQKRTIPVVNGEFGDIRVDVSTKATAGEGSISLFTTDRDHTAVGGARFSVYQPVIADGPIEELTDTELLISLQLLDNKGTAGIRSVICHWKNTVDHIWQETQLLLDADDWYHLAQPIPLPAAGRSIRYWLEITDSEGYSIQTKERAISVPIGADLAIWKASTSGSPEIHYTVKDGLWVLQARLGNLGKRPVKGAFNLVFYDGSPDKDGNLIADEDATFLGSTRVEIDAWQESDGDYLQMADVEAELTEPLSSGVHPIYAWADPQREPKTSEVYGEVPEPYYFNNRAYRLIPVNDFILDHEDVRAYSIDHTFEALIPAAASPPTTISITNSELEPPEQPALTPIPVPTTDKLKQFTLQLHSGRTAFDAAAQVSFRFELQDLRRKVLQQLGLRDGRLTPTDQKNVATALLEGTRSYSVFRHVLEHERWQLVQSAPVMDETGGLLRVPYIRPPDLINQNPQVVRASSIRVDAARTLLGEWSIVFFDAEHYHVYVKRQGAQGYERLEQVGKTADLLQDPVLGIGIAIHQELPSAQPVTLFGFGDTYTFRTIEDAQGAIAVADIRNADRGDGEAFVDVMELADGSEFAMGDWLLFFLGEGSYELHDARDQTVRYTHGSVVKGRTGVPLRLPAMGLQIMVQAGPTPFAFGDTVTFASTEVAQIQASVRHAGSYALMQNSDVQAPQVYLWADGVAVTSGLEIPPRPEMSLLVQDTNGVIPESLRVEQSKDGGEFVPLTLDYSAKDTNTISSAYVPVLFRGDYLYRVFGQDFMGNSIRQGENLYHEFQFTVSRDPDLDPPQITLRSRGKPLEDGAVLTEQPQFHVLVRDNEHLDPKTIRVSFGLPDQLFLLERGEYVQEVDEANQEARLDYAPDLVNGEYLLQVEASDLVGNTSGPQQFRFTMDEAVQISEVFNAPNPFSDNTVFNFTLTQVPDSLEIRIYSVSGRLLRTLEAFDLHRGYNEIDWDGRDEAGDPLANGVVFYRVMMQVNGTDSEQIGKAAILR